MRVLSGGEMRMRVSGIVYCRAVDLICCGLMLWLLQLELLKIIQNEKEDILVTEVLNRSREITHYYGCIKDCFHVFHSLKY